MPGILVAMRKVVMAFILAPTCLPFVPRPIRPDEKSASGEGMIAMRREPAFGFDANVEGCNCRLHVRQVFGEGVEEGRDKHVARQAAKRIEMNVQETLPSKRPAISNAEYTAFRDSTCGQARPPQRAVEDRSDCCCLLANAAQAFQVGCGAAPAIDNGWRMFDQYGSDAPVTRAAFQRR